MSGLEPHGTLDEAAPSLVRRDILGVRALGGGCAYPAEAGLGRALSTAEAALMLQRGGQESGARESGARESGARESGARESGARESGAQEVRAADYDERMGTGTRDWIDRDRPDGAVALAGRAGLRALASAGLAPGAVQATVVSTCTPPHITKNFAAQVALSIDATGAALDLRAGGAGGLEAWLMGAQLASSAQGAVLVIAVETASLYANHGDAGNSLLFGDGAAALVLGAGARHQGLAVSRSATRRAPGDPFSVPGTLPPTADALGLDSYVFQRPSPDYLLALKEGWDDVTSDLRADITRRGVLEVDALPYAVTRSQLDRFEQRLGRDAPRARQQLRAHGCLGVAGPLALAAHRLDSDASKSPIAAAAVGGGISTCSLVWIP